MVHMRKFTREEVESWGIVLPPENPVWNWSQTIDYFIPVLYVALAMFIFSVPVWVIWTYVASTCIWATYKHGQ